MTNLEKNDELSGDFIVPKEKMLFLDDRSKRLMSAIQKYSDRYDLTIVCNVKECLRYLCRQEWDILSLDHDLNGDDFQDPDDKNSGMEVVRYIAKTGWAINFKKPEIWIHSSNLFAANLMIDVLYEAGIKAYYHKFEYDNDNDDHFYDSKVISTVDTTIIPSWVSQEYGKCASCKKTDQILDINAQCYPCWDRELKQCRG